MRRFSATASARSVQISDEMAAGIQWHGSLETWEDQLHAWIERDEVIAPPQYAMS